MTEQKAKKNRIAMFIAILIIALQLARIIYVFAVEKEGFHSDEIWSYGLANSYYQPYLYLDDNYETVNMGRWMEGKELRDYVTVQENERFSYSSVISNMKKDLHPPLYFMVLHTICSFFPDTFSAWYGFSINIFCFIITQIFLFLLSEKLLKSRWKALAVVILYGFTAAGVSVYVFIRHYAMAAMFLTIVLYYHVRLLDETENKNRTKLLVVCAIFSALGMLTLYVNAVVSFFLALIICLYYLFNKEISKMLSYGIAMLFSTVPLLLLSNFWSVATGIGLVQNGGGSGSAEQTVKTGVEGADYLRTALNSISYDFFGAKLFFNIKNTVKDFFVVTIPLWILCIALLVYFEVKKKILGKFWKALKRKAINIGSKIKEEKSKVVIIIAVFVMIIVNIKTLLMSPEIFNMIYRMNRYMFPVYPLIALFLVLVAFGMAFLLAEIFCKIAKMIGKSKFKIGIGVISNCIFIFVGSIILCSGVAKAESKYLFKKGREGLEMEQLSDKSKIGLFLSEDWLVTCFPNLFFNADKVYCDEIGTGSYDKMTNMITSGIKPDFIWIDITFIGTKYGVVEDIVDLNKDMEKIKNTENEYIHLLNYGYGKENIELIGSDSVFDRVFLVYSVK